MKTLATIAAISLSAITFNAWSQDGDKKEKELDKTQESERARSTQGIRTDNELKDDRGEVQSNQYRKINADSSSQGQTEKQVIEPNKDQGLGSDDDGNNLTNKNNTTQDGEKNNNAPAVIQTTSSESGSPAVLSGNNGKDRDGTNNVQRATPNMAGAKEPGNLNLSEKNYAPRNQNTGTEHKVRKQEEQPVQSEQSKKVEETQALPLKKENQKSAELNDEVTTKQEPVQLSAKEHRKAKRQERRNKRRD